MTSKANIANSVFTGWNDSAGIMLCGYEWGWSKKDQIAEEQHSPHEDEKQRKRALQQN